MAIIKGKLMNAIVYKDSESYDCEQVLKAVGNLGCEWYAALHDKDTDETRNSLPWRRKGP